MAKRKRRAPADENSSSDRRVPAEEKIARLLGLLLVNIKKKTDQVPMLRSAGFRVSEVAEMLSSEHAREQAARRGVSEARMLEVASSPEQRQVIRPGRERYGNPASPMRQAVNCTWCGLWLIPHRKVIPW